MYGPMQGRWLCGGGCDAGLTLTNVRPSYLTASGCCCDASKLLVLGARSSAIRNYATVGRCVSVSPEARPVSEVTTGGCARMNETVGRRRSEIRGGESAHSCAGYISGQCDAGLVTDQNHASASPSILTFRPFHTVLSGQEPRISNWTDPREIP